MKIQHPLAIKSAALLLSLWVRALLAIVRRRERFADPATDPRRRGQYIYVVWHENILLGIGTYAPCGVSALISQHRDGELLTQVVECLGGKAVRGSSSRGGVKALRDMLEVLKDRALAITPDGPRGPRRIMQQGAVYLASQTQIKIVPVGICAARAWRMKSWDQFAVVKPFSRAQLVMGTPIAVPPGLEKEQLTPYIALCQKALDAVQAEAEQAVGKSVTNDQ